MSSHTSPCLLAFVVIAFVSDLGPVHAQPPKPFRLDRPEQFFEQVFGKETEAERQAIEQVKISQREEYRAGRTGWESFRAQLKQRGIAIQKRGKDVEYVQHLVRQLQPLMTNARRYRHIEVFVADTDDTDARSFPGGWIVVARGLIEFCESEAALVGVLGHELSHLDRGHQLYHLRRWKRAQQSLSGSFNPERMLDASLMMAKMFTQPFRPEQETEADADGARWAFQLGYEPDELARLFASLHERDQHRPQVMPSFLRSHPFHQDRFRDIARLAETLKQQQPANRLYVGQENLKRRIPRTTREFAE